VREALLVALATASSAATLPVSARVLEEQGVNPKTTGFVLPLGASLNMDGSALYQVLVVLFLGRVAGVDFSITQQLLIFMFVMLSSSGTAGIPGGGLVMMGAMLQMVGIPLELIGIYLLVDRFWDPPITALNVLGDLFGTKTIDRFVRRDIPVKPVLY
jgi:proton glutamate symport protein